MREISALRVHFHLLGKSVPVCMWTDSLFDLSSVLLIFFFKGVGIHFLFLFFLKKNAAFAGMWERQNLFAPSLPCLHPPQTAGGVAGQSVCLFMLRDMPGFNQVTEFLMSYLLFSAELRSHLSRFPPSPFSLHHVPPIYFPSLFYYKLSLFEAGKSCLV